MVTFILANLSFCLQTTYTFQVRSDSTPEMLVQSALEKMAKNSGNRMKETEHFVLKVAGREEYLLGEFPLKQFMVRTQVTMVTG